MKKKKRANRLVVDETPLNSAQEKALAELRAMRALPRAVKSLIRSEVNTAVQTALREMTVKRKA